ncbi:MAG: polysaccharide export protein [Planctomycetaceae bacterium]|nr:polysaccharide export protein [Planctomycetaceae bacterium]
MWLTGCLLCMAGSGCSTVFSKPVMSSTQPGLPWLAGFAAAPVDTAPPFDLTQIQPARRSGTAPDEMLEITIWDLYEPGKPHTFPSRVDSQGQIVVPHLDTVLVTGQTPPEIEAKLSDAYRQQDILKQPRILVRELSSAPIHTYVTGAVLRPGLINLPRDDASVFAALVAAGGLSRNAGLQVYVSDQASSKPAGQAAASVPDALTSTLVAGNSGMQLPAQGATAEASAAVQKSDQLPVGGNDPIAPPLQQMVNHSESVTVSEDGHSKPEIEGAELSNVKRSKVEEAVATRPDRPSKTGTQSQPGRWYDLSVDHDRESLKQLVLRDGDVVTVRPAAPPVRITGAVAQPGAYRSPANNALGLNEAIQLAGGLGTTDLPMVVVLTRPATSERSLERWTFRMGHGEKLPPQAPNVEPGDVIHIEPTAQARVQSLVGSLWPGK